MKLTTDIYLNKVFHLPKCWGVIHRVKEEKHKENSQNDPKNQLFELVLTISLYFNKNCSKFDGLFCMSTLVNILNKIDILGSSGQKTTKEQPKRTVSAGTKTFENLKLKNCRSDIAKACSLCVPT